MFTNLAAAYKSISKYDRPQYAFDDDSWALAGEWTKEHFAFMNGSKVVGIQVAIDECDKQTSGGYPANLHFQTKEQFFSSASLTGFAKPVDILDDYWNVLGGLEVDNITPIWVESQKVELKSIEKLRLNKVRVFTASPVEHTICLNRMCLDMNQKFYNGFDKSWSFVGNTKYLAGWDRLYRKLSVHPNAFELDESDYDASLSAGMLYGQRDIRWSFFDYSYQTPENWRRFERLYDSIVHSLIVLENGELIRKHTGNPSGCGNTISDNTMILYRLFAYAWLKLCPEDMCTRISFETNVCAALNGDDNTYTCSDLVVSWFNPKNIMSVWAEVGVFTKTPDESPRKLDEVSFLSQKFEYDPYIGIYMPVPEANRILCSLLYGSKRKDVRIDFLRACALRIESYGNKTCRVVLAGYIQFLRENYADYLIGTVHMKDGVDIPINDILNLWRSDLWIEALYSGKEKMHSDDLKLFAAVQKFESIKNYSPHSPSCVCFSCVSL